MIGVYGRFEIDRRRKSAMTTIDLHAHAIIPTALSEMASSHPEYGPSLIESNGRRYLGYPGRERLGPLPEAIFDPALRLAGMHRQRVDLQVIAIPPPNFHYHVPARVGVDFARIQNVEMIKLSSSHPDRFHMFAALPLQDIAASLQEIDRVADVPLVRGIQIGASIEGVELDDPSLEAIWTDLENRNLPVWIHPDQRAIAGADRLNVYYLQNLIGIPLESTIAAARLIFGGVLERHPHLRFGFVHGGGFAPYQIGRWDHGWTVRDEAKVHIAEQAPRRYFERMYFDSLTHDVDSLELLGRRVGWDHVVLGSDYPFDMASADPVAGVEAVGLEQKDRLQVLGENANRFLRPVPENGR
jgi:aminocarboxymuconate-semialdehyde decarboxylase